MTSCDVVVIGGGIAGVSAGARLAEQGASVVLVEAEETLAFHTTGRSAAQYLENYGNDEVRKLTLASKPSLLAFLGPRPELKVGRASRVDALKAEVEHAKALVPSTEFLDGDQAREILPILRPDIAGAFYEPDSKDIDVAGYHQSFVQRLRANAGEIVVAAPVRSLTRSNGTWQVTAGDHQIHAPVVVNAAGAWGDRIGALAGAEPLGLHPLRRTIAIAAIPDEFEPAEVQHWPITAFEPDEGGAMAGYCKPEPGGLLVSPADETLSEPCDAKPEELDVALGLHNLAAFTTLDVRHVRSTWAGLRTFTSDRTPVSGFDPSVDGFYWLVGQGGYGIHSSDALAQIAASNIGSTAWPEPLTTLGLTSAHVAADRSGLAGPLIAGH
ncbi:MAG: FAD-binding oxidoreductase [Actinomycetota bacterium]